MNNGKKEIIKLKEKAKITDKKAQKRSRSQACIVPALDQHSKPQNRPASR